MIILAGIYFASSEYTTHYAIHTRGIVLPGKVWELQRYADGNFITLLKDNVNGYTDHYNVTEFSRGDVVEFQLLKAIEENPLVKKGDTVGFIRSNEEQRKYRQLLDELEVLQSELLFFTTGLKPEDIDVSREKMKLAEQDLNTEVLLFRRNQLLFQDSVISQREYEVFENILRLKEAELHVKSAEFQSAITGDKPEQELLIRSKILQTSNQLEILRERLNYFTILSPLDGIIKKGVDLLTDRMQISVWDTSRLAVTIPIEVIDKKHIIPGNIVTFYSQSEKAQMSGKVVSVDNTVKQINNKQIVFATAELDDHLSLETMEELVEVKITADEITLKEYFIRMFNKTISR
ncbi:hypothetical protein ADIS_1183 [Lunatimonas lonarensis]|uniref:HlyD family efflux transporter periplasmic adaptor subunit n=2 Tax=Lunatimonas lonarensis TaxID=1232681 RepID=R7ZVZ3_9BACT|nr:hypothetical protein ADIS_1183 [Lunatimonas lonarensis]